MERTETTKSTSPAIPLQSRPINLPGRILGAIFPAWLRGILRNRKAALGVSILTAFVLIGIFAPVIAPVNPTRMIGRPHEAPSAEHLLGTTRQGQDVFAQIVHGTRTSLTVGFLTGTVVMVIAIVMGLTAGYLGGWVDEVLSLITNVALIIPSLPLIIVVSRWIERPGPETIVLVLSLVSWAYGARVLRSQTLVLRNADF